MLKDISVVFLLLSLLAEIIGTLGGFGSSVFFVPIANFYFDFNTVLGLTAMFHVASNLSKIAQFRKGLNRELLLKLGVPAIVFVIIGGLLSKYMNHEILEILLGVFLIGLSLLFLIKRNLIIKATTRNAISGGVLSGLFAGLLGTGGAIRGLTMAAFNLEKSVFVATSAGIDFGVDFSRLFVYLWNGYIKYDILIYIPFLILVSWVGTWLGKQWLNRLSENRFKSISLLLILFIGLVTLIVAMIK